MENTEKVRENLARRRLKRRGYDMQKSRIGDPKAIGYGTFSILDVRGPATTLVIVLSTIEQVEACLDAE